MRICPSCGGIVGRDCFNPVECAHIAQRQESQAYQNSQVLSGLAEQQAQLISSLQSDLASAKQTIKELQDSVTTLRSMLFASEKFRKEDAYAHIDEENRLRERITELSNHKTE